MLIRYFEAADDAGSGGEQGEAPLKPALANVVGSGFGIMHRVADQSVGRLHLRLHHLADLIFGDGFEDLHCVLLSANQGLGKLVGLLRGHLAGHGRLIRVDDSLH